MPLGHPGSFSLLAAGLLLGRVSLVATAAAADFDIRTFGAIGDGRTLATSAINQAIDTASAAGGGTVHFSAGTYLSFSIRLKSNIRHATNVTVDNVEFSFAKEDQRPAIVLMDVTGIEFHRVKAQRAAGTPFFVLRDVRDFTARAAAGLADTKRASAANESL